MKTWTKHTNLKFREVSSRKKADIVVSFENPQHYDVDDDDMGGRTLAHAFGPGKGIGGDVHIRDDLAWDFDVLSNQKPAKNKRNFFAVLLHELGHSLGLSHSGDYDSTMYAYSNEYAGVLSQDDINGIQFLYGKKGKTKKPK